MGTKIISQTAWVNILYQSKANKQSYRLLFVSPDVTEVRTPNFRKSGWLIFESPDGWFLPMIVLTPEAGS